MIAQLFDRNHSSIQPILAETGGIRPAHRHRSSKSLTLIEREEISRSVVAGESVRAIARRLHRAPSTISREIRRNGGREEYRAVPADQHAWDMARRPKRCKLTALQQLAAVVSEKLQLDWSPEQIAGWLKRAFPISERYQVSHETIYRSLYIQGNILMKTDTDSHLKVGAGSSRKTDSNSPFDVANASSKQPPTLQNGHSPFKTDRCSSRRTHILQNGL